MVSIVDFLCPPRPCSTRAQVTDEDIESFEETYRGSEEEKRDVLQYYSRFKGDMDKARQRKGGADGWLSCGGNRRGGSSSILLSCSRVKDTV